MQGKLYIVATPIGNLGDMTPRAIETLRDSDCIFAEDTRVTLKLLKHFNIDTIAKRCDENTIRDMAPKITEQIRQGHNISFCSDAGMPCVSDPGYVLVEHALNSNVKVEVIPGASALISAIAACGFASENIFFVGFLERKKAAQVMQLKDFHKRFSNLHTSIVIYESPNRLLNTLENIAEIFGDSKIAICRELTKLHEEVIRGTADELFAEFKKRDKIKGEIVIVIDYASCVELGVQNPNINLSDFVKEIFEGLDARLSKKEIASQLSKKTQYSKNDIYDAILLIDKQLKSKVD
ncbi:MAG: 16S rRNA (cytidine(1402)-2'-O)-methyltransferase [Coriobacteriales bacterium]|nr:16S rRNA (cytidine(1402)-2'-O)-methyltransferase [Coriobacteriales bacterium]